MQSDSSIVIEVRRACPVLLGLASGSLALMKSFSRATGVLTKIGGVAMLGAAAYLIWLA